MEEVWKDVRKEYQASNKGRIRSLDRWVDGKNGSKRFIKGKILKPALDGSGYPIVGIHENGKRKTEKIHRLVWEGFNGKIPKGLQVNHINEIKTDNRLENLNLMTCKENINYGTHNERMAKSKSKPVIQKTLQGEVVKVWPSTHEVERQLGYDQGYISACCRGGYYRKGKWYNLTQVNGYRWEYEKATA